MQAAFCKESFHAAPGKKRILALARAMCMDYSPPLSLVALVRAADVDARVVTRVPRCKLYVCPPVVYTPAVCERVEWTARPRQPDRPRVARAE